MPDIPELVAAIDSRLADIAAEMRALDAAKAELAPPRAGSQVPAGTVDAIAPRSRRPAARRRLTPQRPARKRATTARRPRSGGGALGPETLKQLLADTSAGLSANAIAKQAGAGYSSTLKLLHELQAAGEVRRSGSRRSTVWHLITDEERIAQRAAELERLRSTPSRRRGRARAS